MMLSYATIVDLVEFMEQSLQQNISNRGNAKNSTTGSKAVCSKNVFEKEKISYLVCLDIDTTWNSTYKMLEHVEKFEKAFVRMELDDPNYKKYFDGGYNGISNFCEELRDGRKKFVNKKKRDKKIIGPPKHEDFQAARCFAKFLKLFYNMTLKFSGSLYTTSNTFFRELTNYLLFVAVVLDPHFKLEYVEFCFGKIYGHDNILIKSRIASVTECLDELYHEYKRLYTFEQEKFEDLTSSEVSHGMDIDECDKRNKTKFSVLSRLAKDVLAIPVSTVSSKQAFSTSGRVIDSFRSSLTPKTVEALICTQNWLLSTHIDLGESLGNIESLEEIEEDCLNSAPTIIANVDE
ncbi:zinc finger BED domain-containing protein RICESLEEPER 2-like [Nicotiana tabacum]|uniref:Zinc finger BED domain-containing protein RICESLEEPER 2-like n=1 Tax=Nicotiana tabacum TaxID=4097 RepID=A0AC58SJJ9_TOBAC